jgi:hypothetical protein
MLWKPALGGLLVSEDVEVFDIGNLFVGVDVNPNGHV